MYTERRHVFAEMHAYVIKVRFPQINKVASLVVPSDRVPNMTFAPNLFDVSELSAEQMAIGLEYARQGVFATEASVIHTEEFEANPGLRPPQIALGL